MEKESNIVVQLSPKIHNQYLSAIKRLLGASFVGWVQEKNKKYLKVTVKKQDIFLPFEGGEMITEESYKVLIKNIINSYNGGTEIREPVQVDETERGA